MQSVASAFTAEERDSVRKIAQSTLISWKKESTLANISFSIGSSTIGGNDLIAINPGSFGSPSNYHYYDESAYVTALSWEKNLNMPTGGLTKSMAEIRLDNTSGRFTPRYMGGTSELFTAEPLRDPIIINAGFNYNGIDQTIPQFVGIISEQPKIDVKSKSMHIKANDYIDYFQNRYLDREVIFTGQRTDVIMESMLAGTLGLSTAQYNLDLGINIPSFGIFEKGTKYADVFHKLAEAENGHFYQDETGIFRFENRQHYNTTPYTDVQRIILTGQVIEASSPDTDHLINVVEISSNIRTKQPAQTIFSLSTLTSILVPANGSLEQFFEFQDPVLQLTDPTSGGADSYFVANTLSDSTGTDGTSSITATNVGSFAKAVKYRFKNNSVDDLYITQFVLSGRVAKHTSNLYYRERDDSSVTAYQERILHIDNEYIQNESWAASYARMILNDFSSIENIQKLTIRAIPELQLGDLISWQGRYWRIYEIKTTLDPSAGFIQELTILQRTIISYFRIGISLIGGPDSLSP